MKNNSLVLLVFLLLLGISCSQEKIVKNTVPDELIGTWVCEMPGIYGEILFSCTFGETQDEKGVWEAYMNDNIHKSVLVASKGDFKVENDKITYFIRSWGSQQVEPKREEFYESVKWYTPEEVEFNWFANQESKYTMAFNVVGDKLMMNEDENGNGIFEEDEYLTYYRVDIAEPKIF